MPRLRFAALFAPLLACVGAPAPDAALCRDVIHRLCLAPRCEGVDAALDVADGCDEVLIARTGCGVDDFTFTTPSRARVLECRLPLLRSGTQREQHPNCDDVSQTLEQCGDLVSFLAAGPQ